jgi:hypothetical protein
MGSRHHHWHNTMAERQVLKVCSRDDDDDDWMVG